MTEEFTTIDPDTIRVVTTETVVHNRTQLEDMKDKILEKIREVEAEASKVLKQQLQQVTDILDRFGQ